MKRREFLATSATFAQWLAFRSLTAQERALTRAAVVIGVDKSGNLPVLSAVVSGAKVVASWLRTEGFEVTLLVDEGQPVRAAAVFAAVTQLVNRGTLDQLLVYFSGHGFISHYTELWILSDAPDNPNEAISLRECTELSRRTGIPSVVFISDACRSTPQSIGVESVRGSLVFPTGSIRPGVQPEVDQFLATLPGEPAFEVPVSTAVAAFQGIYTASFLGAFRRPDHTMVRTVGGVDVVPNRSMKPYLLREVPRKAAEISIQLNQLPDSRMEFGPDTYIGRPVDTARRWWVDPRASNHPGSRRR